MAQRFIIDININGAKSGGAKEGNGMDSGGALAGAGAAKIMGAGGIKPKTAGGKEQGYAVPYKDGADWFSKKRWEKDGMDTRFGEYDGKLNEDWTRRNISDLKGEQETMFGAGVREGVLPNQKQIVGIGVAAAWKTASTALELQAYTSGDSYANARNANMMKAATYGSVLAMSGPAAPLVGALIVANELAGAYTERVKYNYDRKLERAEITNITSIAGDISYGRNRGGN
jgi:hypothetical protein